LVHEGNLDREIESNILCDEKTLCFVLSWEKDLWSYCVAHNEWTKMLCVIRIQARSLFDILFSVLGNVRLYYLDMKLARILCLDLFGNLNILELNFYLLDGQRARVLNKVVECFWFISQFFLQFLELNCP